jgi:adenylate cyclase
MRPPLPRLTSLLANRVTFGLLLLAGLLAIRVLDPSLTEELRLRGFDFYQRISPRETSARPVVIVDIDEASMAAFGQWPWPRTIIADLLARLEHFEAVAVAFDVIFPEPDRSSPAEAVKHFRDVDPAMRSDLMRLPSHDDLLAQAIKEGKIVLGRSGTSTADSKKLDIPETPFATLGPDPRPFLISFPGVLKNLPELERAAQGRGLFSIVPERDGMVRRIPIVMSAQGRLYPALTLELLRVAVGADAILIKSDQAGVRAVALPGLELPTDENGRIWVHFSQHDKSKYVSAKDVVQGRVSPDQIAGKLVLVGTSAIGLLDVKTTPVNAAMPGVEVHAQVLESALTGALLASPNFAIVVEMAAAILAASLIALLAPSAGALTLFSCALVSMLLLAAGSWILFSQFQLLIDATFPMSAVLVVYMSLVLIGYFREQSDRRRIRTAFAQYLSPSLVEQLASAPEKLVLGGEKRTMTVLFSDVRGFTTISEGYKDDPQGLTTLMNRLLTPLTNAIVRRGGTIDKYIGDALMAFWNAPIDDPHQEVNAAHAALDMLSSVDELNRAREAEAAAAGVPFVPIRIGIGINTGPCAVGNMGSDLRFQYTVMGDTVNLASRLEGQTKVYGLPIIVGSATANALTKEFALLEVDSLMVKGKTIAEVVYSVVGRDDLARSAEYEKLHTQWLRFLECYRSEDWSRAGELLQLCRPTLEELGASGMIEIYSRRIEEHCVPASSRAPAFAEQPV